MKNLCLAGGVALNCVANGRILREGPFDDIWIQPAAGDAGGALGAALFVWHQLPGAAARRPTAATTGSADLTSGPPVRTSEIERVPDDPRPCRTSTLPQRGRCPNASRACIAERERHRLVPGADGVRPAGAGRRAASWAIARSPEDAVGDEPEDQVPRVVPPLRAVGARRARRRGGSRSTGPAPTCCWSPPCAPRGASA